MEPTDGKATDAERRASAGTSRSISNQQEGAFEDDDDDYALLALGISDGFRPQPIDTGDRSDAPNATARPVSEAVPVPPTQPVPPTEPSPPTEPEAIPSTDPLPQTEPQSKTEPQPPSQWQPTADLTSTPLRLNRLSTSKPPRGRDSLTLRHDGPMGHVTGPSHSRVSSVSTQPPHAVDEEPYQGPSAPSHPYQMYSQDPRPDRTLSIATTSSTPTTRPESEYNGPRGPAHPYAMYPQNPFTDTSTPVAAPTVPAIPVGFVNNTDPYQRRLGPEGEEIADIIGPDGHTEELPPYTRYPDEYYNRKIRDIQEVQPEGAAAATSAATASASASTSAHAPASDSTSVPADVTPVAATPAVPATGNAPATTTRAIPGAGGIGLAARDPEFDSVSEAGMPQSRNSTLSLTNESHHEVNTAAAPMSEKPQLNKFQKFGKRKACGVIPYWAICLTVSAIVIVVVIIGAVVGTLLGHHKETHGGKPRPSSYQDSIPSVTITYDAIPIPTPTGLPPLPTGIYSLPLNLDKSPNTCFNDTAQTSAWSCNINFEQAIEMQMSISRNTAQLGNQGNYDVQLITNSSLGITENNLAYGAQPPLIDPALGMELVNDTFDSDRGPAWFRMIPYNKTVVVPEDLMAGANSPKLRRSRSGSSGAGYMQHKGYAQAGDKPWVCYWPGTVVEVFIYAEQNSSYASQTAVSTGVITAVPTPTSTAGKTKEHMIDYLPLASYPRAVKVKERRDFQAQPPYCLQYIVNADNSTSPLFDTGGNPVTMHIDEDEPGPDEEEETQPGTPKSKGTRHWPGPETLNKRLLTRDDDGDMSACGCMWFSS